MRNAATKNLLPANGLQNGFGNEDSHGKGTFDAPYVLNSDDEDENDLEEGEIKEEHNCTFDDWEDGNDSKGSPHEEEGEEEDLRHQHAHTEDSAEGSERMIFDEERGLFYDSFTSLHYDSATNLFYNLSALEPNSPCFHWNPSSASFMAVLVDKIAIFPPPSLDDDQDRGDKPTQTYTDDTTSCMQFDETSGNYFDKRTGLYYSPACDLYFDYNIYPAVCYHRMHNDNYVQVINSAPEQQDGTTSEEGLPSKLMLVAFGLDDDTQRASYLIGDLPAPAGPAPAPSASASETKQPSRERVFTLGRSSMNDIVLDHDVVVSKVHARIVWQNVYWQNFFWLQDLGSNNGTFLNGKRLSDSRTVSGEKECPLQINDNIVIGNTKLVVSVHQTEPTVQPLSTDLPSSSSSSSQDMFTSSFKPNLDHPLFRPLREWMSQEEERRKAAELKKLYCSLTPEERKARAALKTKYRDRTQVRKERDQKKRPRTGEAESQQQQQQQHQQAIFASYSEEEEGQQDAEMSSSSFEHYRQQQSSFMNHPRARANRMMGKGEMMLRGMGWEAGQGLGREGSGAIEPVQASFTNFSDTTRGLGFGGDTATALKYPTTKSDRWQRARERFDQLS